ncbi:NAD(P)H-quinone oxidoreductase [Micrococcus endophyticus]|uniref:NAD(P)H-quinone oxidoreductase n=1 Tax=Micrococcus endophyticus TaxID=455343 RepID=UPI001C9DE622
MSETTRTPGTGRGTMRAVRFTGEGGAGSLAVGQEPIPTPGPGEVLVKVAAAGLNRADVMQREGKYPPPPGASDVPGLEVSGVVVALGEEAGLPGEGRFAPGDEVCALLAGGGYAEHVVVPAGQLMAVPPGVDLVTAAALPEVACTVWSTMSERGGVRAGDVVLVHGGSGGIGTFAVQYLAAIGARVLATAGGPAKCERVRGLGAEDVFDHRSGEPGAFADWVLERTGGRGADVVLDVVGGPYLDANVRCLAEEGRIVVIAVQGGPKADGFNLMRLVSKRGWLTGATLRARSVVDKARIVAGTERAVAPLVAAGRIDLAVGARFPLDDAAAAHRRFEAEDRVGRVLLVTDPADALWPQEDRT